MKGQDVYEWLDRFVAEDNPFPGFAFTYIGRTKAKLPNSKIVQPVFGKALGDELRKGWIYISGSRYDPGPNHVLEALACGLKTYVHRLGGGAVEFAGEDHCFGTVDELRGILLARAHEPNEFQPGSWEDCITAYMEIMGLK